MHLMKLAKYRK